MNGRGLPAGYLVALENRLSETEAALHQALSEIYTGRAMERAPAMDVVGKAKSVLMDEWKRLPLGNKTNQYEWWTEKSSALGSQTAEGSERRRTRTPQVLQNIEPERGEAITEANMHSRLGPEQHSSVWEPSNMQISEYVGQEDTTVQPVGEIQDAHPELSTFGTHHGEISLSPVSRQRHEDPFGHSRQPDAAGDVNRAQEYAAIHENIYF
jgi:hypothetical protein